MKVRFQIGVALLAALVTPAASRAQVVVVGSTVQEREATPGETYTGEIRLRNNGRELKEVRVYQTDYRFYADGRTLYDEPATHERSNAGWMRVTPTRVVVPPGELAEVSYTVTVPDEPLSGSYWSMIMVEPVEPVRADDPAGPGVGLRTVIRFGIQVATHVPGASAHRVAIRQPRVVTDTAGVRSLEFAIVNEGDVAYRPHVSLEVYDVEGTVNAAAEAQRGLLYPGTSALQRFELAGLAPGSYEALVAVDTGSLEVFGAQFKLTIAPRE